MWPAFERNYIIQNMSVGLKNNVRIHDPTTAMPGRGGHRGQLSGRGDVDPHDPGVGVGTADDGGVEHVGEDEVVDVSPAAPQEPGVLDPGDGLADPLEVSGVLANGWHGLPPRRVPRRRWARARRRPAPPR